MRETVRHIGLHDLEPWLILCDVGLVLGTYPRQVRLYVSA